MTTTYCVWFALRVRWVREYAHQQGVIHWDIKPENILPHGGRLMVADFGITLAVRGMPMTGNPRGAASLSQSPNESFGSGGPLKRSLALLIP
jgi:serine/threonine protein kinase